MPGKKWSEKEMEYLKEVWGKGVSTLVIAKVLGRTKSAIKYKVYTLSLYRKNNEEKDKL